MKSDAAITYNAKTSFIRLVKRQIVLLSLSQKASTATATLLVILPSKHRKDVVLLFSNFETCSLYFTAESIT